MNKQEAMLKLRESSWSYEDNSFKLVRIIDFDKAQEIVSKIYESRKVVISRYVAEWIKECKSKYYSLRHAMKYGNLPDKVNKWLLETFPYGYPFRNQDIFASAWLNGYEVEGEVLYTVSIAGATLTKITEGIAVQYRMIHFGDDSITYTGDSVYTTYLTEADIKSYGKRLWEFAVPVKM